MLLKETRSSLEITATAVESPKNDFYPETLYLAILPTQSSTRQAKTRSRLGKDI